MYPYVTQCPLNPLTSWWILMAYAIACLWLLVPRQGCFGHDLPKPTHLWGTLPNLGAMTRKMTRAKRSQIQQRLTRRNARRVRPRFYYFKKFPQGGHTGGVSGTEDLGKTADYTAEFCRSLLRIWIVAFNHYHQIWGDVCQSPDSRASCQASCWSVVCFLLMQKCTERPRFPPTLLTSWHFLTQTSQTLSHPVTVNPCQPIILVYLPLFGAFRGRVGSSTVSYVVVCSCCVHSASRYEQTLAESADAPKAVYGLGMPRERQPWAGTAVGDSGSERRTSADYRRLEFAFRIF